jgi:hypothetical protein
MKGTLVFLVIFILFAGSALAIESFSIVNSQTVVNSYGCGSGTVAFSVLNTNPVMESVTYVTDNQTAKEVRTQTPVESIYSIMLSGKAAEWSTVAPNRFGTRSGDKEDITIFYAIPCSEKRSQTLTLVIATDRGLTQQFDILFNIGRAQNLKLVPRTNYFEGCPCKPAVFEYVVQNTGSFAENYIVAVDKFAEYARLSESQLTLEPGNSKSVFLYINAPCQIYGSYQGTFSVTALNNGMIAETPYYVKINPCYQYQTWLGQITAKNVTVQTFQAMSGGYSICEGQTRKIPIMFKNVAEIPNSYELSLKAPEWLKLGENGFSLMNGQSRIVEVDISPPLKSSGNYAFPLEVLSVVGNLRGQLTIPISVENCNSPRFDIPQKLAVNYSSQSNEFQITNTGTKQATYTLNIYGANFAEISPKILTLGPATSGKISIKTTPSSTTEKGDYAVTITAKTEDLEFQDTVHIVLSEQKPSLALQAIVSAFSLYKWYLLAGIVPLIIIFVFATALLRKKPEEAKEAEIPREEGKIEKVYKSIEEERKAMQRQLKETKQEQKRTLIEARKEARLEQRRIKIEESQKARLAVQKAREKAKRPRFARIIFILFVLACLAAIAYFGYQWYKQRPLVPTGGQVTQPTGAKPTFTILPAENVTRIPEKIDLKARMTEWFDLAKGWAIIYKNYLIGAAAVVLFFILIIVATKIKNKKRFFGWLIAIVIIGLIVTWFIVYKPKIHLLPEKIPINATKNVTQLQRPVYQQDLILKVLENGTYGYDKDGNVVNIKNGVRISTADFISALKKNRGQIVNKTQISELELNMTIKGLELMSSRKPAAIENVTVTQQNVTVEQVEQQPQAPQFPENCSIELRQNTPRVINLSIGFTDPDQDILSYWSTKPDRITVTIDGEMAEFMPEKDFMGVDYITITADDAQGGTVSSGNLTICVRKGEQSSASLFEQIKSYISTYLIYIISGFAILVIIVTLIRYSESRAKLEEQLQAPKPKRKRK